MDANNEVSVILPSEAEYYIQAIEAISFREVGGPKWRNQHERIEKLNMQALINVSSKTDEYIKESLISYNKMSTLIFDLISTELWKHKVFPHLLKLGIDSKSTLPIYMVLFHEATVASLLETTMYHEEPCECAGDNIMDLVDYCHRKITHLLSAEDKDLEDDISVGMSSLNISTKEELRKQDTTISFNISLKSLSLLRYITDHMTSLPLGVMTRILNTHDIPCLLVNILELSPWTKKTKDGKVQKFIDGKWKVIPDSEKLKVTKLEGQVWLTLYQLLMNPESQRKYEFSTHNKNQILKLRQWLNELLLDQIPCLSHMQRYLEQLAIMEPPSAKNELILEQVPEILQTLEGAYSKKWKEIAQYQYKEYFNPSEVEIREQAKKWAATYNIDVLEGLVDDPPKCALCWQTAAKRCSRCQNEWYCSRPCQVKHWAKHKSLCNVIAENKVG